MSSIGPGFGPLPIASSLAGVSSSGKQSSIEQTSKADNSAAKAVDAALTETGGLKGSEKSSDRDADGRQMFEEPAGHQTEHQTRDESKPLPRPRSKDPDKTRGNRLDFDA